MTEVLAAFWGKVTRGEIGPSHAAALDRLFVDDLRSDRFAVLPLRPAVVDRSLACVRRHRLRAGDAVQLASALLARDADPGVATLATFDQALRDAASAEGFALLPR